MVARQILLCSGTRALVKPQLQPIITEKLLNIDKINKGIQKDLLKGDAIETFDKYIKETCKQKEIIEFTKKQLNSSVQKQIKEYKDTSLKLFGATYDRIEFVEATNRPILARWLDELDDLEDEEDYGTGS